MAAPRPRLHVGDVFTIPIDDQRVGYGQIVHKHSGRFWFAVYDTTGLLDDAADLDAIVASPVALLASSFDALLYHGVWKVIGRRPVDAEALPWPAFKVATSPTTWAVVDYTGERTRPAGEDEIERLPFRCDVAPVRVQDATRAMHGAAPWSAEDYDELLPVDERCTTAHVFATTPRPAAPGARDHIVDQLVARHAAPEPSSRSDHARFFLTVPNRRAWWRLRRALDQLGLTATAYRDIDGNWSVTVERHGPIDRIVDQLGELAESVGGEYDGHERQVA